jgi:hypothetical protein
MDRRRRTGIVTAAILAVVAITDLASESKRGPPNRIRGLVTVATVRGGPHSRRIRYRSHESNPGRGLQRNRPDEIGPRFLFLPFTCIRRLQMYSEKTQLASILKWLVMN